MKIKLLSRLRAGVDGMMNGLMLSGSGRHAFAGAEMSRKFMDWVWASLSADKEIQFDLRRLRARARDLQRNDAYTKRILKLLKANVVGHRGIRLEAQVRIAKGAQAGELDAEANTEIERAFKEWAGEPNEVMANGALDWIHFQQQAISEIAQDGEVFIRMLPGFKSEFGLALEFIDPDRLYETHNQPASSREGKNEICMGIERNQWGRPVAYHILTAHPSDLVDRREIERVPAEQIIHIFNRDRATQSRGVTWLAPIMRDLKIMDGYFEAELIAARMGAAKMGFIESDMDSYVGEGNPPQQEKMDANPGVIDVLAPGRKFVPWLNDHPSTAFPNFIKAVLRRIASGVNAAYNLIANDLEGVSYSSIRQGELNGRDEWRINQTWLATFLHRRVYREWLRMALISKKLKLKTYNPADYYEVTWRARGWSWVDPLKDIQASILAIQARLASPQDTVGEGGDDYEEIQEKLAEAEKMVMQNAAVGKLEMDEGAPPSEAADGSANAIPVKLKKAKAPTTGNPDPGAATDPAATPAAGGGEAVQDTALNGAQVTALLEIIDSVATGKLPAGTAEAMILAAFPAIKPEQVKTMLAELANFKPAAPEPQPATPGAPPVPPEPPAAAAA